MVAVYNGIVILIAGALGSLLKVGIPQRVQRNLMQAIGLSILAIGIVSLDVDGDSMILIASMVLGAMIGSWFDFDSRISNFIYELERKTKRSDTGSSWTEGFLAGSMLFCIGSMVIVGSLESGLSGNDATLYTKTILDGISAFLMASSLGIGVAGASIPVVIIEGTLILLARFLAPYLSLAVIDNMVFVGGVLLIALALNLLEVMDIKVMNFVLAVFFPIIFGLFL